MPARIVHLIPHTHWDREWYLPLGGFQARLGAMLDDLLLLLETDGRLNTFLLDGQTVLLEDYLAVRPRQRTALLAALRAGRLQSGPWYVLPDEQIPAAESLLRNLALGREDLRRLDPAASGTCYSPDAFGHPAALPALAREFGLTTAVLWRGLHPDAIGNRDLCWWEAPDGRRVLVYHLPADGYEIGSALVGLPHRGDAGDGQLARAWAGVADRVLPRAATSHVAVLVGADHHGADPALGTLAARLSRVERGLQFRMSSLPQFFAAVERELPDLDVVRGDLRDSSGHTWTLQGVHGTRAPLKRRNSALELLLLRHAEPLAALAGTVGNGPRAGPGGCWCSATSTIPSPAPSAMPPRRRWPPGSPMWRRLPGRRFARAAMRWWATIPTPPGRARRAPPACTCGIPPPARAGAWSWPR